MEYNTELLYLGEYGKPAANGEHTDKEEFIGISGNCSVEYPQRAIIMLQAKEIDRKNKK